MTKGDFLLDKPMLLCYINLKGGRYIKKTFSIIVPEEIVQQLDNIAFSEKKSRNAVIGEAIKRMITEKGAEAKQIIKARLEER